MNIKEKNVTLFSSGTALLLVLTKFLVGLMSGSVAVLASAVDSLLDFFVSIFNYFALHHSEKEPDEKFHFGRKKIEPMAAIIEGVIITLSGIYIVYEAFNKISKHEVISYVSISIYVMIFSLIITSGLVYFLTTMAKKTNNLVLKADALHYKTDLYSNSFVLLGLIIVYFTNFYYIDFILGIGIGIYMIYSAFPLIKESVLILLDISLEETEIKEIEYIINSYKNEIFKGFHQLRTRLSANECYISVHLEFDGEVQLKTAHEVNNKIQEEIKNKLDKLEVHMITHMDIHK